MPRRAVVILCDGTTLEGPGDETENDEIESVANKEKPVREIGLLGIQHRVVAPLEGPPLPKIISHKKERKKENRQIGKQPGEVLELSSHHYRPLRIRRVMQ